MTALDWIIVAFTLVMALYGYAQGFLVGALSLAGFAGGAILGTRLGPKLLEGGSASPYAPLFGLLGAVVAGGILATGLEGVALQLRARLRAPVLAAADGVLGAALTGCVALGVAWIGGAVALQTPGATQLRRDIQRSAVLRHLNDILPPSGTILHALARVDPFPSVRGPAARVGPPNTRTARDPDVRRAAASVVRVLGTACGLGLEGSGWVARRGVVVTNAHVVAGETDTTVQVEGQGPKLDAQAIAFDSRNDVAVLRVPGAAAAPLPLAPNPSPGTPAAIIGFPENGPLDVEPGRLAQTATVISDDAYGNGPVTRRIASLRGRVRHGNSGGPLVDDRGRVLATIFGTSVGSGGRAGFAVPNDVVSRDLSAAGGPVGTGPCAP